MLSASAQHFRYNATGFLGCFRQRREKVWIFFAIKYGRPNRCRDEFACHRKSCDHSEEERGRKKEKNLKRPVLGP